MTLEQFPALESFNKRMINVTNSIMNQAIASCEESGDPEYRVDINKYNRVGEPAVYPALIDDMLRDLGTLFARLQLAFFIVRLYQFSA